MKPIPDEISNTADVIDSRDVIARIEYLAGEREALTEALETAQARWAESADSEGKSAMDIVAADHETRARELADWDEEYGDELRALQALATQAEGYAEDWQYGEVLIRDSYFTEYAEELAIDCGYIDTKQEYQWPFTCIDWERAARDLQIDYPAVDFDGVTYWVR